MPFWTNACKYGQINSPASDASLCADLINAHLSAGWTTVSGDLSDMILESLPTPTLGLQMQVRIYSPTANYVYYRPIEPFTTASPDQMRIYRHPSWMYRYSISPYQSLFWKWGFDGNWGERMGGFGCPWWPDEFNGVITDCAWVHRSDQAGFRTEGDQFYVSAKLNALSEVTEWFYIEHQNPQMVGNISGNRLGLVGIDSGHTYWDPIIACTNLGLGGARFVGGLWDAAISRQSTNVPYVPNFRDHGHREVFDGRIIEQVTRGGSSSGWVMWFRGSNDA